MVERPPNVAVAAAKIHYKGNDVRLDEAVMGTARSVTSSPSTVHPELFEALSTRTDKEAGTWIALPTNATWSEARRLVHTAFEAGAAPVWIGPVGAEPAIGPLRNTSHTKAMMDCGPDGVIVSGMGQRLSFEVQMEASNRWVSPTLRFLPKGADGTLIELLPDSCWRGATCAQLNDPLAVKSCEAALATPAKPDSRLILGGPNGCIVPVAKGEATWRAPLPAALTALGVDADTPMLVMADEPLPLGDVLQLFAGLADHGVPSPGVGLLNMGSGESVPKCDNPIRTPEDVAREAGRWFGNTLATLVEETPDEQP